MGVEKPNQEIIETKNGIILYKDIPYIIERTQELEGEPGGGEVEFIEQIHRNSGSRAIEISEKESTIIGKTQFAIYKYLKRNNAQVIFYEGGVAEQEIVEQAKRIPKDISKRKWEELTQEQQLLFSGKIGGAEIYGYTHVGVKIFPTSNEKIKRKIAEIFEAESIQELNRLVIENIDFILNSREEFAASLIEDYLEKHPSKKVFLIYGGAHTFKDDFKKFRKEPRMFIGRFKNLSYERTKKFVKEAQKIKKESNKARDNIRINK